MKNIILVAFYFKPYQGVGAFRPSYWHDRLRKDGFNVTTITNTPEASTENDKSIIRLSLKSSIIDKFISDKSLRWGFKCRKILKELLSIAPNSIVILTGGPFLHFASLIRLKKIFSKSYWILDYRDPLANNPINQHSNNFFNVLKKIIKTNYERYSNNLADIIITVNKYCKELIVGNNLIKIIENGYDERIFSSITRGKKYKFVYSGKTGSKRDISQFCSVFENIDEKDKFVYIGNSEVKCSSSNYINAGFLPYSKAIEVLSQSEVGIVLSTGESFESTTKVFDYFAAELKILIITSGKIKTGNLFEIVKDNPNVEWASNNCDDITKAIIKLDRPYVQWDYSSYSRDKRYKELLEIINNL